MKLRIIFACFAIFWQFAVFAQFATFAQNVNGEFLLWAAGHKAKVAAFQFAGVDYFHRFTKDDQHEYTPAGQEDLNAWTDMVTLLIYRKAKDGEALAATANAVLDSYKAARGMVVKTDSVPRTRDKPAEHLIVVIFGRPGYIEAAFTRLRMYEGVGSAVVYSHRIYGKRVGDEMAAWMKANGPTTERNLMAWDAMPRLLASS